MDIRPQLLSCLKAQQAGGEDWVDVMVKEEAVVVVVMEMVDNAHKQDLQELIK